MHVLSSRGSGAEAPEPPASTVAEQVRHVSKLLAAVETHWLALHLAFARVIFLVWTVRTRST